MKVRILVIDDDKQIVDLVASFLIDIMGLVAISANTYNEGFLLATTEKLDLIICDINLGGKDGVDLIKCLRNLQIFTPAIMISGDTAREKAITKGKEFDPNLFVLGKPFKLEKLEKWVTSILNEEKVNTSGITVFQDLAPIYTKKNSIADSENSFGTIKYTVFVGERNIRTTPSIILENETSTICPDIEIGCSLGCRFCRSWLKFKDGQEVISLTASEIYQQVDRVIAANSNYDKKSIIALVGGGSYERNYIAVIDAIRMIASDFNVDSFIVSTPGNAKFINRLSRDIVRLDLPKITMSWSLTYTHPEERQDMMPASDSIPKVVAALKKFSGEVRINHIVRKNSHPEDLYQFLIKYDLLKIKIRLSYPIPGGEISLQEIHEHEMENYIWYLCKRGGLKFMVKAIHPSYQKRKTLENEVKIKIA